MVIPVRVVEIYQSPFSSHPHKAPEGDLGDQGTAPPTESGPTLKPARLPSPPGPRRTNLKALGADFLPLLHPCDPRLGFPCGLAHEGGHPSRQPNLVLGDLNKDRFAWKRQRRDTQSPWHGHIRHDPTLREQSLGGEGHERLTDPAITPNSACQSQALLKELNP